MAQTVAVQRGTGTATSNTNVTLFTQSGGLSTRVILNQLTLYTSGTDMYYPKCNIVHLSSNGAASIIGYMRLGVNGIYSFSFLGANNGVGPVQTNGATTGSAPVNGLIVNSQNNAWQGNASPGNSDLYFGSSYYMYMPSNYYIGPSDSIQLKWYDGNGTNATYGFSFTTITES